MTERTTLIVPPRPNPGPEPLPSAGGLPIGWIVGGSILAIIIGAAMVLGLRRRRDRPKRIAETAGPEPTLEAKLRERLASLFDATWPTLTVEEIAERGALADRFGPEAAERLLDYLRRAERVRCSGRMEEMGDAESWVAHFLDFVGSAGARSTINGR